MWAEPHLSDTLEQLVGWAVVDSDFASELLRDPVTAATARVGALTPLETRLVREYGGDDLASLAGNWLRGWRELTGGPPAPERARRPIRPATLAPAAVGA